MIYQLEEEPALVPASDPEAMLQALQDQKVDLVLAPLQDDLSLPSAVSLPGAAIGVPATATVPIQETAATPVVAEEALAPIADLSGGGAVLPSRQYATSGEFEAGLRSSMKTCRLKAPLQPVLLAPLTLLGWP